MNLKWAGDGPDSPENQDQGIETAEEIPEECYGEDFQENGEEEDLDDDPIFDLFGEENQNAEAGIPEVEDLDPAMAAPSTPQAIPDVVDLDPIAPMEPERRALVDPPLARPLVPSRRHGQHEKSFQFGLFFVKFRDDRSELYPERIPSWRVECPVHENCALDLGLETLWSSMVPVSFCWTFVGTTDHT